MWILVVYLWEGKSIPCESRILKKNFFHYAFAKSSRINQDGWYGWLVELLFQYTFKQIFLIWQQKSIHRNAINAEIHIIFLFVFLIFCPFNYSFDEFV